MTGLTLALRVTPRAKRNAITAVEAGPLVKIAVRAPPEKGRATEAALLLLAEAWRVPRSAVALIRGETSRNKIAFIAGEPEALCARLEELTAMLKDSGPWVQS